MGRMACLRVVWQVALSFHVIGCSGDSPVGSDGSVPEDGPGILRVNQLPAWSPDGQKIAYTHAAQSLEEHKRGKLQVWVYDVQTDDTSFLVAGGAPQWSPEGTELVYFRDGDIWIVELATKQSRLLTECHFCSTPMWSPAGDEIMFRGALSPGPETLLLIRPDGLDLRDTGLLFGTSEWSPDASKILLTSATEDSLWVIGHEDGLEHRTLLVSHAPDFIRYPRWSHTQKQITYARFGPTVGVPGETWAIDEDGHQSTSLIESGRMAAWSPDGTLLVYEKVDPETRRLDIWIASKNWQETRPMLR